MKGLWVRWWSIVSPNKQHMAAPGSAKVLKIELAAGCATQGKRINRRNIARTLRREGKTSDHFL